MSLVQGGGQWMVWMLINNEGRGWANVPISSIRQPTTGSRLFFKPPPSSLPMSYSPCQQSFFLRSSFGGVSGFCVFACFFSDIFFQIWTEFQFFEPCEMWESPMFLYSPEQCSSVSQTSYLNLISPYRVQGQGICNLFLLWGSQAQEDFSLWRKR